MQRLRPFLPVAAIVGLGACSSTPGGRADPDRGDPAGSGTASDAAPLPTPRIVLAIVVDQLPMWLAIERWSKLPNTGGFTKLLTEANGVVELHFGHASNMTSSGHAALFTGGSPHDAGITTDRKLGLAGEHLTSLHDPKTHVLTALGKEERSSSSLETLRAPTVADALRAERPDALIMSLSMKDQGALLGAGKKPDSVLWFDGASDSLVTSSAFSSEMPGWSRPFATPGAAATYRERSWVPLDPRWLAALTDLPAPDLGQGDFLGLGSRFPHDPAKASKPAHGFPMTPFADTFLIDAAIAAVDEAVGRKRPTLISLSLSAADQVGHVFGPDAPEAWDQMLRLDADLHRLLLHLDAKLGPAGYAVVLSGDHGMSSTPEVMNQGFCDRPDADRFERRCDRARGGLFGDLLDVQISQSQRAVGEGDWVLGVAEPFVVLQPAARALPRDKLDRLVAAVTQALLATPGVARAIDVRTSPASCPAPGDESMDALVCRSIRGSQGGDVFVAPKPGAFFDAGHVPGDGANHGTAYLYDRAVPLVVRAPRPTVPPQSSIAAMPLDGRVVVDQRAFAATLASLLGVAAPTFAAGGTDLSSAVVR